MYLNTTLLYINAEAVISYYYHYLPVVSRSGIYYNKTTMKILLDKIMLKKNLSVRQVSIATGISKSTINRIANGEISPTADMLELLAKGLKVRISDLIDSPYQ